METGLPVFAFILIRGVFGMPPEGRRGSTYTPHPDPEAVPAAGAPGAPEATPCPASAGINASPGECRVLCLIWAGAAAPGRDYDGPKLAVNTFA